MVELMFNMKFDTFYTDAANNTANMAETLAAVREVDPDAIESMNSGPISQASGEPVLGELTDFPTPRYVPRGLTYKSPHLQATGVPAKTLLIMDVRRLAIEAHHQRLEQLKMEDCSKDLKCHLKNSKKVKTTGLLVNTWMFVVYSRHGGWRQALILTAKPAGVCNENT